MLVRSGDLIPVHPEALNIPWNKRKTLVYNHLYRGLVTFQTFVYDTNVGDVSPISSYFNPKKWTVDDLNNKFGVKTANFRIPVGTETTSSGTTTSSSASSSAESTDLDKSTEVPKDKSILPKLILLPPLTESMGGVQFPSNFDLNVPPPPMNFSSMPLLEQQQAPPSMGPLNVYYTPHQPSLIAKPPNLISGIQDRSVQHLTNNSQNHISLIDLSHLFPSKMFLHDQSYDQRDSVQHLVPLNLVNLCHPLDERAMYQAIFGTSNVNSFNMDESRLSGTNVTNESSFAFDMSLESYLPQNLNDYINNGSYSNDKGMMVFEPTVVQ